MKQSLLKGIKVSKSFENNGKKMQVLDSICVDIFEGDFTVIMGPSGAGKSTLLYALSGMDTISEGSVEYKAQEISGISEKKMAELRAKEFGFKNIGDWYLDVNGEARFDLPPALANKPGLILIMSNVPLLISGTAHFGPRVGDFVHALRGETRNAEIHRQISSRLKTGERVSLWVFEGDSARSMKRKAIDAFQPIWNRS